MRTLILTGLAGLALVAAADGAQARARIHFGHARPHAEAHPQAHPQRHPQAGIRPAAPAPDLAVRQRPGVRPTYVLLPGVGGGLDRAVPALVPPNAAPAPSPAPAQGAAPQSADPKAVAPQPGDPKAGDPKAGEPRLAAPVAAPAKAVAEAGPWCRSGRVVGTGTGFCLVN